ncbi:hypothetical protein HN51_020661 [Arachis hypogaea]
MENMQYAEELFQEFLVFRGFTNTLQSYDSELRTNLGKGFYVNKIIDLIFSLYVPKFQVDRLIAPRLLATLSKIQTSLPRFYVVHALQANSRDRVIDFFAVHDSDLLQRSQDWTRWLVRLVPFVAFSPVAIAFSVTVVCGLRFRLLVALLAFLTSRRLAPSA